MEYDFFKENDIGLIGIEIYAKLDNHSELSTNIKFKLTDIFKKLYLTPTDTKIIDKKKAGFSGMKWHLSLIDEDHIAEHINSMPYHDFLKTAYWKFTARNVRQDLDNRCQGCNVGSSLHVPDVHHMSYKRHGYEATKGYEDLTCLCRYCHNLVHDKWQPPSNSIELISHRMLQIKGFIR
jgi:hypothetical protein